MKWGAKDTDEMTKRERDIALRCFLAGLSLGAGLGITILFIVWWLL